MSNIDRLSAAELRIVLDAIELLQTDHSLPGLCHRIERALEQAISYDMVCIDNFAQDDAVYTHHWANSVWEQIGLKYMDPFMAYINQHPFLESALHDGLATARRISDVMSETTFKRLDLYHEFYRQLGLDRQMIVGVPTSPLTTISVSRSGREFDERDKRLLQTLQPYCTAAVQVSTHIATLKMHNDSLERAIEASEARVVFVSPHGHVKHMTAAAKQLLEQVFGPTSTRSKTLPAELGTWVRNQLGGSNGDDLPALEIATSFVRNGCRFDARLIRDSEIGHLVMLSTTGAGSVDLAGSTEDARRINITDREMEVLRWVEQGMSNADVAMLCGVSVRTVHKHLQHVFDKLNVENRAAAVRKARDLLVERQPRASALRDAASGRRA